MDWFPNVLIALAILVLVDAGWLLMALVVGGVARCMHVRSKAPWRSFNRDAERLHRLTHPEDDSAPKP